MPTKTDVFTGAEEFISEVENVKTSIEDLLTPPFSVVEIGKVLTALIHAAEALIPEGGQGKIKHELVRDIWKELDKEYGITDRLDKAIPAPFWLEPFDGAIIRGAIDLLIIMTVTALNASGWGKMVR